MNCREFEEIVQDLARARGIDAITVKAGLAHAYACAPCAERLEGERSLAKVLKRLAQDASTEQAPLRVEAALLAAFRQLHRPARHRQIWKVAWAACAAVAALAISFSVWHGWPSPKQGGITTPVTVSVPVIPSAENAVASVREGPTPVVVPKRAGKKIAPLEERDEFAEGFVALPYADTYGPLEAGEIVRVQLGRAALESLGLPVAGTDAGQQVLADVVVGQDGLPRAVRFLN